MALTTSDINKINTMTFDIVDEPIVEENNMKSSYRLTDEDIAGMPDDTRDIDTLRCRLSEYFTEKFENKYTELEIKCDIKRDTFQRVLKHKNGNNITYALLAKFCLGAGLTEDETVELFALNGHLLNEKSTYDYLLLCEIRNKGTVEDFDEDLRNNKFKSIISDPNGRPYKDEQ